jgi:hypothetical protein
LYGIAGLSKANISSDDVCEADHTEKVLESSAPSPNSDVRFGSIRDRVEPAARRMGGAKRYPSIASWRAKMMGFAKGSTHPTGLICPTGCSRPMTGSAKQSILSFFAR